MGSLQAQGAAFFHYKSDMVIDVVDRASQKLFDGARAAFIVKANPLKGGGRLGAEDAGQLHAGGGDDGQFLFQVAIVVGQRGGEAVFVRAEERRVVVREHALHAVGHDRLEVAEVAND